MTDIQWIYSFECEMTCSFFPFTPFSHSRFSAFHFLTPLHSPSNCTAIQSHPFLHSLAHLIIQTVTKYNSNYYSCHFLFKQYDFGRRTTHKKMLSRFCYSLKPCRHSLSSLFGTFSLDCAWRLVPCRTIIWNPASFDNTYKSIQRLTSQEWTSPFRFLMVNLKPWRLESATP